MRKLFQSEWHNIKFADIANVSSRSLADQKFYENFYRAFFKKYRSYKELDPSWLKLKTSIADYCIHDHFRSTKRSILSIGCGIGIIEKRLFEKGYLNITVTESSPIPLKWISNILPPDQILISSLLANVPCNSFDHLLMGGIDYFLDEDQLSCLLNSSKSYLTPSGSLVMISWSFEEKSTTDPTDSEDQQFWGWVRTIEEFKDLFVKSGFQNVKHEIIDTQTKWKTLILSAQL